MSGSILLPFALVLVLLAACAAWSARTARGPIAARTSHLALAIGISLVLLALLRLWSEWAIPSPFPSSWSDPAAFLVLALVPSATCHLVCQAAVKRKKSMPVAVALGFASGLAALVMVSAPAYLVACALVGECA
jgi:hypothetical protein